MTTTIKPGDKLYAVDTQAMPPAVQTATVSKLSHGIAMLRPSAGRAFGYSRAVVPATMDTHGIATTRDGAIDLAIAEERKDAAQAAEAYNEAVATIAALEALKERDK